MTKALALLGAAVVCGLAGYGFATLVLDVQVRRAGRDLASLLDATDAPDPYLAGLQWNETGEEIDAWRVVAHG